MISRERFPRPLIAAICAPIASTSPMRSPVLMAAFHARCADQGLQLVVDELLD